MLYDLSIAWSPSTTKDQLLQTLSLAASLGYGTVALNHTYHQSPPSDPKAPFPAFSDDEIRDKKLPQILHRATLPLADPAASTYRLQTLIRAYDILAVRPLTDKAFQNACLTLDVPIISLDLTQHFPFHFRPKPCMAAIGRGVRFEICYAQALNATDMRARATFIGNVMNLVRATKGRGIIISSEAKGVLGLRAPADVVNLLNVWGLGNEKGMEGLGTVPRSVVVNEGIKRNGFRGVIDIVQTAERPPNHRDEAEAKSQPGQGNSKQSKKQKRKNGEEGGPQPGQRQSKKMKVVTRDADKGKK